MRIACCKSRASRLVAISCVVAAFGVPAVAAADSKEVGGIASRCPEDAGVGIRNLLFESKDYDWAQYGRQLYMAIWKQWHRQLLATAEKSDLLELGDSESPIHYCATIEFIVHRNGEVTGATLAEESSFRNVNTASLETIRRLAAEPLPDDYPRPEVHVHVRFVMAHRSGSQSLVVMLRQMHEAGLF